VRVDVPESLRLFLSARHRHGELTVSSDGDATAGHLIESLGIPRTEIGGIRINGVPADTRDQPADGDQVEVLDVTRPQRYDQPRFLLDVHLGTLARRLRLLGIDTAYSNDADDPELVEQAIAEDRILLTQDRGLLRRRALPAGGYVRGGDPDEQLLDVLERFDPPRAPWSRCPACNGLLEPVAKAQIEHLLEPGTQQAFTDFSQCQGCERLYWRGAHAEQLTAIVAGAPAHD